MNNGLGNKWIWLFIIAIDLVLLFFAWGEVYRRVERASFIGKSAFYIPEVIESTCNRDISNECLNDLEGGSL